MGNAKEIQTLVSDLLNQVESIGRFNLEQNLACLENCRKYLHSNHHLMTELRGRIIPVICRSANSTHDDYSFQVVLKKRQFCKENLSVFNVITPGYTTHRGGLLFELADSEFNLSKRSHYVGELSETEFVERLRNVKSILLECTQCLSNERSGSIEQYYEKSAMVRLNDILSYLISFESFQKANGNT